MDQRSKLERLIWDKIGPPLYYCADCMRAVSVTPVAGAEPVIKRPCGPECSAGIIAPRKAICVGKGGASMGTKLKIASMQIASAITGRTV